jgi:hypothetical protein
VDYRVRAGAQEFGGPRKHTVGRGFEEADDGRVVGAIGLGHTTDATRYGLSYGTQALSPIKAQYATLILEDGHAPRVEPPGRGVALEPDQQAVQLPLLAQAGQPLDRARERGDLRMRAALCVSSDGRVVFAQVRHDSSDTLTAALLRFDCSEVLELNRGSHHPAFFHRAGTPTPPMDGYDASALYLLARPMIPHAFRWKASGAVPSTKVTSFDADVADEPNDAGTDAAPDSASRNGTHAASIPAPANSTR